MFKQEKAYASFAEFLQKIEEEPNNTHHIELEKVDGAKVVISFEVSNIKKKLVLICTGDNNDEESA